MVFHGSEFVFHGFSWFRVCFSWFQVSFHGYSWLLDGFHGSWSVSGWFSWFFMVPGWFQVGFSWFQVGFCVLMVTGRFSKKRVIHDKSKYRNKMAYVRTSNFRPDNDSFRPRSKMQIWSIRSILTQFAYLKAGGGPMYLGFGLG